MDPRLKRILPRVQCMGCGADRLLERGKCDEALTRRERAERGEV